MVIPIRLMKLSNMMIIIFLFLYFCSRFCFHASSDLNLSRCFVICVFRSQINFLFSFFLVPGVR